MSGWEMGTCAETKTSSGTASWLWGDIDADIKSKTRECEMLRSEGSIKI